MPPFGNNLPVATLGVAFLALSPHHYEHVMAEGVFCRSVDEATVTPALVGREALTGRINAQPGIAPQRGKAATRRVKEPVQGIRIGDAARHSQSEVVIAVEIEILRLEEEGGTGEYWLHRGHWQSLYCLAGTLHNDGLDDPLAACQRVQLKPPLAISSA